MLNCTFCFDDGLLDSYQLGFRLFYGGISEIDGHSYPGLYYTDGCGNPIAFTASIAWYTVNEQGIDIHNGSNSRHMTYSHALQLYEHGWSFLNHSYDHSANFAGINYSYQLSHNDQVFYNRVGEGLKYVVPPSGDTNYIGPAFELGAPAVFTSNGSTLNNNNAYKADNQVPSYQPIFWRNHINSDNDDAISLIQDIENTFSETGDQNHLWWNEFTHSIQYENNAGSVEFVEFKKYMENLEDEYGISGKDNCLFANSVEVFEYMVVRDNVEIKRSRSGRNETVVIDYYACPDYLRYNDISLLIEGESIKDISVTSPASVSYALHKNGYLVNISLPESYFTGIEEKVNFSKDLDIYPNPSIGKFMVKTSFPLDSNTTVRLVDLTGRTYYPDIRIITPQTLQIDIDRNIVCSGIYFVVVEDNRAYSQSEKIIIK